jgi:hypothetical protein
MDDAQAAPAVERVLAGEMSYDDLDEPAQALVRSAWDRKLGARISVVDFEEELRASGRPWAEADSDGNVVVRHPD